MSCEYPDIQADAKLQSVLAILRQWWYGDGQPRDRPRVIRNLPLLRELLAAAGRHKEATALEWPWGLSAKYQNLMVCLPRPFTTHVGQVNCAPLFWFVPGEVELLRAGPLSCTGRSHDRSRLVLDSSHPLGEAPATAAPDLLDTLIPYFQETP